MKLRLDFSPLERALHAGPQPTGKDRGLAPTTHCWDLPTDEGHTDPNGRPVASFGRPLPRERNLTPKDLKNPRLSQTVPQSIIGDMKLYTTLGMMAALTLSFSPAPAWACGHDAHQASGKHCHRKCDHQAKQKASAGEKTVAVECGCGSGGPCGCTPSECKCDVMNREKAEKMKTAS